MTQEELKSLAQDPKTFLQSPVELEQKIRLKERELQRYYDLAFGITQTIKPVATFSSGPSRKIELCSTEIVTLEKEIKEEAAAFTRRIALTKEAINLLQEPAQYNVLWARYICRLSWTKVAETLGWSDRWCFRMHAKALRELKRIAAEKIE